MKRIVSFLQNYSKAFEALKNGFAEGGNLRKVLLTLVSVTGSAYLAASVGVAISIPYIAPVETQAGQPKQANKDLQYQSKISKPNFRDIVNGIKRRNLFNSDGAFPEETDDKKTEEKPKKEFTLEGPCGDTQMKLTLVGTLYFEGGSDSVAVVQEAGIEQTDLYRIGDTIIGKDQAKIVAIERKKVVINNDGNKECLQISDSADAARLSKAPKSVFATESSPLAKAAGAIDDSPAGPVVLEAAWVESELGAGFGKVIQSARLVPNMEDNQTNGFKIFAIRKGSLLDRVGLRNGDVITQVNEANLKQPDQGFALYQAFQDDANITIHVLTGGKTPRTLSVQIK